jgi:hypothetical protein
VATQGAEVIKVATPGVEVMAATIGVEVMAATIIGAVWVL